MTARKGQPKPAHYTGSYHVRARRVRDNANADPGTRCWRCGLTLTEARAKHRRNIVWQAGHIIDAHPDSPLAPECSLCNIRAGIRRREQLRRARRRTAYTW